MGKKRNSNSGKSPKILNVVCLLRLSLNVVLQVSELIRIYLLCISINSFSKIVTKLVRVLQSL